MGGTSFPYLTKVFVSYSHKDKQHLKRLQIHLAPLTIEEEIDLWDDTKIEPGADWKDKIDQAVRSARIAILLISADFLASKFIAEVELSPLLVAVQQKGALILPIIVGPCAFHDSKLSRFQAVNSPEEPLAKMERPKREEIWMKVAAYVKDARAVDNQLWEEERVAETAANKVVNDSLVEENKAGWDAAPFAECLSTFTTRQLSLLFTFLTIKQGVNAPLKKSALIGAICKVINNNLSVLEKIHCYAEEMGWSPLLECLSDHYTSEIHVHR